MGLLKISETPLAGVCVIDITPMSDFRGFFARSWCDRELAAAGLNARVVQCDVSFSHKRGTIRGMHWQASPHAETKILRCTQGAVFDVALDLRRDSKTYRQWTSVELSAKNHRMIYVPPGFAHGFQTLTDDAEVTYLMSSHYDRESASGARWNDPQFGIEWPVADPILLDRDAAYPDFDGRDVP